MFAPACVLLCFVTCSQGRRSTSKNLYHEWAVEIEKTSLSDLSQVAKRIAEKFDLEFVRAISEEHMPEYFHFRASKKRLHDSNGMTKALLRNPEVKWAERQFHHNLVTKNIYDDINKELQKTYYNDPQCRCHNTSRQGDKVLTQDVFDAMNQKKFNISVLTRFNDYRWPCQWELYNCGQTDGPNEYDLSIVPTWNKGIDGEGMVIAVIDNGIEHRNRDLAKNYDPVSSFDFVEYPDYDGPLPAAGKTHGTETAGVISMTANNTFCGVGIVHRAKLVAIRMLGGVTTDVVEAASLIHKANYIDVYSNSWGPADTGSIYQRPQFLTATALQRSATLGRNGKGNIHAIASGNGGAVNDHCGADGYSCSIYTIAIAASSHNGNWVDYSEQCTCIMVSVPSGDPKHLTNEYKTGGNLIHPMVTTTGLKCTNSFRGTSAVTPLASSVFLMTLQTNPNLTWRDVQHLIAETALAVNPKDSGWQINGAGFHVHPYYGFGALNALHMTAAAEKWINVDEQKKCTLGFPMHIRKIPSGGILVLNGSSTGCQDTKDQVLKLEHVQVILSYNVKCRGDINIKLTSPCGTVSPLMNTRKLDTNKAIKLWPYMSVFHWGEDPRGVWKLEIKDNKGTASCQRDASETTAGHLTYFSLVLWGVRENQRSRSASSPVCLTRTDINEELMQKTKADDKYKAFIKSLSDKEIVMKELYLQFLEDFSQINRRNESNTLHQPRPRLFKKDKAKPLRFEELAMRLWKSSFVTTHSKSLALADYIVNGKEPEATRISSKHFAVVRHLLARKLRSHTLSNDFVNKFLVESAKALTSEKEREIGLLLFPSKEKTADVLHHLSFVWD